MQSLEKSAAVLCVGVLVGLFGCSSDDDSSGTGGTGGHAGSTSSTGGKSGSSGSSGTGGKAGSPSTGGKGGTTSSGGSGATGGTNEMGGEAGMTQGGSSGSGGSSGKGGSSGASGKGGSAGKAGSGAGGKGGMGGTGGGGGSAGVAGNPSGTWVNASGNLAGLSSMCGSSGTIMALPDEDHLYAGVANHGIYESTDEGTTWKFLDASTGINFSPSMFLLDPDHSTNFWEVGNHANPPAFFTDDGGSTFKTIGMDTFAPLDNISVDFSDPDRKTQLAGPHETTTTVYVSNDSGASWTNVGSSLTAGAFCSGVLVIDSMTLVVGCNNGDIFRSTNAGGHWDKVSSLGDFRPPLRMTSGPIFWGGQHGLIHSSDDGMTWNAMLSDQSVQAVPPVALPNDGTAVVTASGIVVTFDDGAHWTHATTAIPFTPWTFTYSIPEKAFYAAWGSCDGSNAVPSNVVMKFAYDATSGN